MPPIHVHATQTLLAFGRTYFDLHREKDLPAAELGRDHRAVNHDWYQAGLAGMWTMDDPFPAWIQETMRRIAGEWGPDAAEEHQVWLSHDYADFIWDGLGRDERKYQESVCCWLVLHPEHLLRYGQVDVVHGTVQRTIGGVEVWQYEPLLISEYGRLKRYVQAVLSRDSELQDLLERYG